MGVASQFAKEIIPAFTKKVFGSAPPPKGSLSVINTMGNIDIDTFSKAIDQDSTVREPLEALLINAGDGSDDAYDILMYAAKDFAEENTRVGKLSKAEQAKGLAATKKWNAEMQLIDDAANPKVTGGAGRKAKTAVGSIDKKGVVTHHQQGMLYQPEPDQALKAYRGADRFVTEGHHVNILDEYNKIPTQHASYAGVTPDSPSPIVEAMERIMGVKAGNNVANIADVLSTMTKNSRTARVQGLVEQSEGILNPATVNDYLGLSKYKPTEFTQEQVVGLNLFKRNNPDATVEDFVVAWKEQTGQTIPEGQFPNIRVYAPDAVTSGKKKSAPLETIEIKSQKDHNKRINLIFDALDRHKIDTTKARQNFDRSKILVDSKLDVYGYDHEITHQILREMKKMEGTAQYEIEQLGPDGIFNLSLDEAIKLQIRSAQEMETVLANVLQYRYAKVKELFGRLNPELGPEGYEKLLAEEKQVFFKTNVNTLAVMGNVEKAMTMDAAMKPIKDWNNHISDTFGWRPQSLWITIEQIEEVTKELAEKVQPTMPGT